MAGLVAVHLGEVLLGSLGVGLDGVGALVPVGRADLAVLCDVSRDITAAEVARGGRG
jgi:hypothetical protein